MGPQVLVVGAGPTGLMAALLLARSGVAVRVLAAAAGPTDQSRALIVQSRTLELWHRLGLAEAAVADGQVVRQAHLMANGRPARRPVLDFRTAAVGRSLFPFALIYEQSKTERLLLGALRAAGADVNWRTRVTGLVQDEHGVDVAVEGPAGPGQVRVGWVVGADGAGSAVRKALGVAFRGGTYEQQFFLADVDLDWPYGRDRLWVDAADQSVFAALPMAGGQRFRVLGSLTAEQQRWASEAGLSAAEVEEALREVGGIDLRITDARWATVYRLHHRRAERFRVGRVFLAGDAAHVHSPAGGQGMNTGVGDAFNLAWKLAAVVHGEAAEDLLDSYAAERVPVADRLLRSTDRAFALLASRSRAWQVLRVRLVPRMTWLAARLGRLVFRMVSQHWISYRGGPAVLDAGPRGAVRAGDRLPHSELTDRLTGVGWHLLVLGDAELVEACRAWAARRHDVAAVVIEPTATAARRALGVRADSALLLVRPDGYLGLRSEPADRADLDRYRFAPRPVAALRAGT